MKRFKIAMIGAGSVGFTRALVRDLLAVPEFRDNVDFSLTDISAHNLDMVVQLLQREIEANGLKLKLHATTNRREAVTDAKYVINTVRIGGLEAFSTDIEIPLQYGVDQCVGDTLCAGGIMYGQRGIAAVMDFCKDIREVAKPDCIMLNYANPNAMLTWACNEFGGVKTIGLCHGVQGGRDLIAKALGLKYEDLDIICAGINHQTWYISVKYKGEDMTGKILEAMESNPEIEPYEKVRIDMLRRFGYFSTESNGHLSEYVPWYRKRVEEIPQWIHMGSWILGETGGYLRVCVEGRNWFETDFPNWLKEEPVKFDQSNRSYEHGSYIIEALETGRVYRGHFNVRNDGAITNLPDDAIVEVPGYVDANGINIPKVGDLPLGCAAVCNASISVQRMAVYAAIEGNDTLLRQAMMMDPLTGAVCNPPEIWQMVDQFLIEQEQWLPQYKKAIAAAKKRWAAAEKKGTLLPRKKTEGAARIKSRSVEEMKDREEMKRLAGASDKGKLIADKKK